MQLKKTSTIYTWWKTKPLIGTLIWTFFNEYKLFMHELSINFAVLWSKLFKQHWFIHLNTSPRRNSVVYGISWSDKFNVRPKWSELFIYLLWCQALCEKVKVIVTCIDIKDLRKNIGLSSKCKNEINHRKIGYFGLSLHTRITRAIHVAVGYKSSFRLLFCKCTDYLNEYYLT